MPGQELRPIGLGITDRYQLDGGTVLGLDEQLRVVRRRDVEVTEGASLLAATQDLEFVALSYLDRLVVHSADRTLEVGIESAETGVFLGDGRLVVSASVIGDHEYDGEGDYLVQLVDVTSGDILDTVVLDVADAAVSAVQHPHDGSVLIDAGMGQDGSASFVVRVSGDRLDVAPLPEDVCVTGFDPPGRRLLLTPHPANDDVATVVEWPSLRTIGELRGESLGFEDEAIKIYGCFVGDDRIVLQVGEGQTDGVLLCTGDLTPVAWLDLDPDGESELDSILGVGPGMFVAEVWRGREKSLEIWRVPREIS